MPAPLFYAKDRRVWKRPVKANTDKIGGGVVMGFHVCDVNEYVGDEGVAFVVAALNAAEQPKEDEPE